MKNIHYGLCLSTDLSISLILQINKRTGQPAGTCREVRSTENPHSASGQCNNSATPHQIIPLRLPALSGHGKN